MRRFLSYTVLFVVATLIGLKIAQDPGYAYFSYADTSVEMPLWLAFILFILTIIFTYFLVCAIHNISRAASYFQQKRQTKIRVRAMKKTRLGIIAYLEGNFSKSEKLLSGQRESKTPVCPQNRAYGSVHGSSY